MEILAKLVSVLYLTRQASVLFQSLSHAVGAPLLCISLFQESHQYNPGEDIQILDTLHEPLTMLRRLHPWSKKAECKVLLIERQILVPGNQDLPQWHHSTMQVKLL